MLSSVRPSRPCRKLVVATTCAALLGATASAAQSTPNGPPDSTPNGPPICQPGATLQDLDYILQRYAGYYTEQEIRSGFAANDVNGNGLICGKPFAHEQHFPLQQIHDDRIEGNR